MDLLHVLLAQVARRHRVLGHRDSSLLYLHGVREVVGQVKALENGPGCILELVEIRSYR